MKPNVQGLSDMSTTLENTDIITFCILPKTSRDLSTMSPAESQKRRHCLKSKAET
jgi:hypothetical protein